MAKTKKLLDAMAGAKPLALTDYQINLGSKYLAASNLGMDVSRCKNAADIMRVYSECDRDCAEGTGDIEGPGAEPERKSFEKHLRSKKDKAYWLKELHDEIPWLFNVPDPRFF